MKKIPTIKASFGILFLSVSLFACKAKNKTADTKVLSATDSVQLKEFEKWKERLFTYNESANLDDRVFITQNLFLDLIGGNVTKLSQLYRDNEETIKAHNVKMGKELSDNRKMISRVKKEGCQNLAEWIKGKCA